MPFKNFVPTEVASWQTYWNKTSIEDGLGNCQTDGLLPILEKYLPKQGKIIEAGCGLGKWVIYLSKKGYNILGVDFYEGAIKALKKYDSNLNAEVSDVQNLKYKDETFDVYLSFGVIEHWEEGPGKPLKEAFRILKSGGVAVIETPYNSPLRQITRELNNLLRLLKLPIKIFIETFGLRKKRVSPQMKFYEYHYSKEELTNFIKAAGFEILDVQPKDDTSPQKSIALWIDFPSLRENGKPNFFLNETGQLIKKILNPFPWFWSCCVVVIAKKS